MTPSRRTTWESREGSRVGYDEPVASEGAVSDAPDETAAPIRVELPWPAKALHPNARVHWGVRASEAKRARRTAGWAAKEAGLSKINAEALHVSLTFHPRSRRAVDLDGCLSACKSQLDGLADVVGIDDSRWEIAIRKAEPRPPHGAVVVEITVTG